MKMTSIFLIYAFMVITVIMGTITGVDPSQLKSKILDGQRAKVAHSYMASLQLDDIHICSSGMFRTGYLLTTMDCALFIRKSILIKKMKGTAVLGSLKLSTGQRVDIDQIKYTSNGRISSYRVGVIKLARYVDYTNILPLDLYREQIDLRHVGIYAMMCGWGTVKSDDSAGSSIGNASSSDNLHCMYLSLASVTTCKPSIPTGDYRTKLICGVAENQEQAPTLGDVGGPLTKIVQSGKREKEFIIGVTIDRYHGQNGTFLRFIRSSLIFPHIRRIMADLDSDLEESNCISSDEEKSTDKQYKRRKYK